MIELFREYTQRLTNFAVKAQSKIFDWVMYRSPKILTFSK